MIEIELNKIRKNYGYDDVLKDFSITVSTGEKVALIGNNGSGKSTVLKIINKDENVNAGSVNIRKGASVKMLNQLYEQEEENITVLEFINQSFEELNLIESNINQLEKEMALNPNMEQIDKILNRYGKLQEKYQMLGGYEREEKLSKACTGLGITKDMLNMKYNILSGGEKARVNLAKILVQKPDILLLDEPTNHLDISSLEWLEKYLQGYNGTVLLVSHDRFFMDKVVSKVVLLENGKESVYNGNYSYFLKEDERRTLAAFEVYKNQQKQIEKMQESIKTLRKFGYLAQNEMFFKRAKSIEKRLEKMQVVDKVETNKPSINLDFNFKERSSKEVVKIRQLNKAYGDKIIFKNINLNVYFKDKLCILGKNGVGKTTLINMILKKDKDYIGTVDIGENVKIGYIPQNIIFEDENMTVLKYFENVCYGQNKDVRAILSKYYFCGDDVFKRVGSLSGGEKVRIMLASLVQKDLNLLILDEPTNHIDIYTREILEDAIKEYKGTVIMISHDRYFINSVATKIAEIENNAISTYDGNYDTFLEFKENFSKGGRKK